MRLCRARSLSSSLLAHISALSVRAIIAETSDISHPAQLSATPAFPRDFHKFITRPDIDAPIWDIKVNGDNGSSLAPGYWFVAFYGELVQHQPGPLWLGPHIYDARGELVWSGASAFKHWNVFDFGVAQDLSGDVLTLLSEHEKTAYIMDSSYRVRKEVPLVIGDETQANMHSFHVIDGGRRALVLNKRILKASERESRHMGFDNLCDARYQGFRELDMESRDSLVFQWHTKDHIGLNESTYKSQNGNITTMCTHSWDVVHLNSIDKFPDGDYLLSARHTDALYKVSHIDGSIVWRLGGTRSDFRFVESTSRFSRQHHARVRSQQGSHIVITLFDNAVGDDYWKEPLYHYSRGLVLSLDTTATTAQTLVKFPHPDGRLTSARGSFQTLPNGNAFVNWAESSHLSEHAPDGTLLMQAKLSVPAHTYRAFKYPWVGRPINPPDVVAEAVFNGNDIITVVHMSWNGATEVVLWKVNEVRDGQKRVIDAFEAHWFRDPGDLHGICTATICGSG